MKTFKKICDPVLMYRNVLPPFVNSVEGIYCKHSKKYVFMLTFSCCHFIEPMLSDKTNTMCLSTLFRQKQIIKQGVDETFFSLLVALNIELVLTVGQITKHSDASDRRYNS